MDALIGNTGFLGRNLANQHGFEAGFDSRTIHQAVGQSFGTLVCAAAPGSMFEANRFPDTDRQRIDSLISSLDRIGAERIVLISTIATLENFAADNEDASAFETNIAYGVNRRRLEMFVESRFPTHLIVRLPALFGRGLKKNFLFDVMNPMPSMLTPSRLNQLRSRLGGPLGDLVADYYAWSDELALNILDRPRFDTSSDCESLNSAVVAAGMSASGFTNPRSRFQYYDLARLWTDIGIGLAAGLPTLHLSPAPVAAGTLFHEITGGHMPENEAPMHGEDMRTGHAAYWNRSGPYIVNQDEVLAGVAAFIERERTVP